MPVFWLFCFEAGDLTDVALDGEQVPTLTAPLSAVRERLATRDAVAREWFPGFAGLWGKWRQAIGGLGQQFLKLDSYALSCMGDHRDFASGLFMALDGEKRDSAVFRSNIPEIYAVPLPALAATFLGTSVAIMTAGLDAGVNCSAKGGR